MQVIYFNGTAIKISFERYDWLLLVNSSLLQPSATLAIQTTFIQIYTIDIVRINKTKQIWYNTSPFEGFCYCIYCK